MDIITFALEGGFCEFRWGRNMIGGYMGRILFVDLSNKRMSEETPDESLYRDFIGCYGIAARILYSRQKAGADPLGPENTFGLVTGPLTGTPAVTGCRFVAVGKSPLTGGWGDANSGGDFGPHLKFAGYDAVFFTGISEKPVYLLIDNGQAEIKDAGLLWGKDTFQTDDILQAEHGKAAKVAGIGPAGERCSLLSSIISHRGAACGRSGLGAIMGSKKLKAVVVKGDMKVPIADIDAVSTLRREQLEEFKGPKKMLLERFHQFGTASHVAASAHGGDSPVKNWGGIGVIDLPDVSGLEPGVIMANVGHSVACWQCPVACRSTMKAGTGEFPYPADARRPEYESFAAFGAMCLNNNADVVIATNHMCNAYGIDTISTGTAVAFAMECYEHGILTKADTDGIELVWGNRRAIIDLTDKILKREGLGDVLADGVRVAAQKIGRGADKFAVHIGGQELGLHDPKGGFMAYVGKPMGAMYAMDATPGRHTTGFGPTQFPGYLINAAGLCLHYNLVGGDPRKYQAGFMAAVTGLDRSWEELLKAGQRIGTIRHLFSLREGDNPLERTIHPRVIGRPPQEEGPLRGVSVDIEAQTYWNLGALDWDPATTKPSKKKLLELGITDAAADLYP
jgi:aldehyde:ferredoxin oxidoreductase